MSTCLLSIIVMSQWLSLFTLNIEKCRPILLFFNMFLWLQWVWWLKYHQQLLTPEYSSTLSVIYTRSVGRWTEEMSNGDVFTPWGWRTCTLSEQQSQSFRSSGSCVCCSRDQWVCWSSCLWGRHGVCGGGAQMTAQGSPSNSEACLSRVLLLVNSAQSRLNVT